MAENYFQRLTDMQGRYVLGQDTFQLIGQLKISHIIKGGNLESEFLSMLRATFKVYDIPMPFIKLLPHLDANIDCICFLQAQDNHDHLKILGLLDERVFRSKMLAVKPNGFTNERYSEGVMKFIHQRRLVQMFNDINYPGSRNQYAAPLGQEARMWHFNATSNPRTNSPPISRSGFNHSVKLTAKISQDEHNIRDVPLASYSRKRAHIPRAESNHVVDKVIKCDPNDCHSPGDYDRHDHQTCDYDDHPTSNKFVQALPTRTRDNYACTTGADGCQFRLTHAKNINARPTGANQSLARPTGADQSLARSTGADQSLARPTGADQSLARLTGADQLLARPKDDRANLTIPKDADDRDARSISDDNCNHRVFTIGPGFRRYIQRGLDDLAMKALIRLVMLIKVIQDDVPLD